MEALDDTKLAPGSQKVKIEFYRKDNKFLGVHKGLNRQELVSNTHFRVLFISGISLNASKSTIHEVCQKYGEVDILTLKTKIEFGRVISRGIAIVQFSTKEGA